MYCKILERSFSVTIGTSAFENASRMKPNDVFPLIQIANILLQPMPNNSEIPSQLEPLSNKILKI